jgi:hypothetical protein
MEKAAAIVTKAPQSLALTTVLGVITTAAEAMLAKCVFAGSGGGQRR